MISRVLKQAYFNLGVREQQGSIYILTTIIRNCIKNRLKTSLPFHARVYCQLYLKHLKFHHAKKAQRISQEVFKMKYELFPEVP